MEEENQFLVELEKLMTSEVSCTLWANNMDLMALTTYDNLIELYRISYKAQRVFQIQESKPITSMSFSPDSQLLAYGLSDGTLKLVKTQNGERIVIVETVHNAEVQNLSFLNYCSLDSTNFLPFQKNSMESRLILNICPHKNCNKNAIIKINYFSEMKRQFTLLLSSQHNKTVLLINGFITLAELNYGGLGLNSPRVLYSHYDGVIRSIVAQEKQKSNAGALETLREHLIKFNCLIAYISQILAFVEITYDSAQLLVRDILRQYNSKINLIDDPNDQNLNPCQELFKFLNCGSTSTAIVNFFSKQVYDSKILQKLDETLNACFAQLHDLLLESIQNSLQKATILLKRLQNFAEVKEVELLGLQKHQLAQIQQKIIKLYTMGQILLVESTQAKFDIRNLLVWLNKATIKSSGQNQVQIQNTKSYLNKYTVDFNRLHSFLANQKKFKLQNLLCFFSKTNQSTQLHLEPAQFRILTGQQPHTSPNPQQTQTFNKLAKLFEVDDIVASNQQKMQIEQVYSSYKLQMKNLLLDWRNLSRIPQQKVSQMIGTQWKKTLIGQVQVSQLFQFELKTNIKDSQLFIYFVSRKGGVDSLVEYNCHKHIKNELTSKTSHILSIAVADHILAVLQNKTTTLKIIAQIANEEMNGEQIEIGKRISRAQGELDINCSSRGLNSLVLDKNKLIIFT